MKQTNIAKNRINYSTQHLFGTFFAAPKVSEIKIADQLAGLRSSQIILW
jgi:hypothetical protein